MAILKNIQELIKQLPKTLSAQAGLARTQKQAEEFLRETPGVSLEPQKKPLEEQIFTGWEKTIAKTPEAGLKIPATFSLSSQIMSKTAQYITSREGQSVIKNIAEKTIDIIRTPLAQMPYVQEIARDPVKAAAVGRAPLFAGIDIGTEVAGKFVASSLANFITTLPRFSTEAVLTAQRIIDTDFKPREIELSPIAQKIFGREKLSDWMEKWKDNAQGVQGMFPNINPEAAMATSFGITVLGVALDAWISSLQTKAMLSEFTKLAPDAAHYGAWAELGYPSNEAEAEKAFRGLVHKWHPHKVYYLKNPDLTSLYTKTMARANTAYETFGKVHKFQPPNTNTIRNVIGRAAQALLSKPGEAARVFFYGGFEEMIPGVVKLLPGEAIVPAPKIGLQLEERIPAEIARKLQQAASLARAEKSLIPAEKEQLKNLGMTLKVAFDMAKGITPAIPEALEPLAQGEQTYKIIKQTGIEEVKGTPVKIVDGVDTFLHKDENGNWVVSEAMTGRDLSGGGFDNSTFAIKAAKANIENVGVDKFKQLISEKQLPKPEPLAREVDILTQAKKAVAEGKSAEEFVNSRLQSEKDKLIKPIQEKVDVLKLRNTRDISPKVGKSISNQIDVLEKKIRHIQNNTTEITSGGKSFIVESKRLDRTKSQLIAIYDQAVKGVEVSPEIAREVRIEPPVRPVEPIELVRPEVAPEITPVAKPPTLRELGITPEPSPFIRKRETTLLKDRVRNLSRGFREGRKFTREEITQTQKELRDIVRESDLSGVDREKLRIRLSKVQTQEQLKEVLPEIKEKIANLEQVAEKRTAISKLRETVGGLDVKKLRPEFKGVVEDLLVEVDVLNTSAKKLENLVGTRNFLARNPDNIMPPSVLKNLELLEKKQLRDLTTEDIENLTAAISHADHLNKFKNSLIYAGKARNAKEIINRAIANVSKKPTILPGEISTETTIHEANMIQRALGVDSLNTETQGLRLDGFNEVGLEDIVKKITTGEIKNEAIINETIYELFSDGVNEMYAFQQKGMDFIKSKIKGIDVSDWSWNMVMKDGVKKQLGQRFLSEGAIKDVDIQIINTPDAGIVKMTKGERIGFLLNERNAVNKRNLLAKGFSFRQSSTLIHNITEADLDAIIDSATIDEIKVADAFYEYFNTFAKPKINKSSVKLNGFEIATVEDYYPKITNLLDTKRNFLKQPANLTPETLANFTRQTLEGMGILKERTGALNAIIIDDAFKVVVEHSKKVGAYVGLADALRNAKALIYNPDFKVQLINRWGKQNWDYLKNYIDSIENTSRNTDSLERMGTELINRLDPAILGLNPWVMAKQPVSYLLASTEMDTKYLKEAVAKFSPETTKEMIKHSPFFRNRIEEGAITIELGEVANAGEIRRIFTGKSSFVSKFMGGIRHFDQMAIGRIWEAVKLEVKDKFPNLTEEQYWKVVEKRARQVTERTQPTFEFHSRSAIGRSRNLFTRLATKYTTQRNKNLNLLVKAAGRYQNSAKTAKDKSRFMKDIFIVGVVTPLLIAGINVARRQVFGTKESKAKDPNIIIQLALEAAASNLSIVYVVGDVFSSAISKIKTGTYAGWGYNNPVTSFIDTGVDAIAESTRTIHQIITKEEYKTGEKKGEEKWKTSAQRALKYALSTVGALEGIPAPEIMRWIERGWRIFEKEEPTIDLKFDFSGLGAKKTKASKFDFSGLK